MNINPHETALPFLIKPWHTAIVRWDKKESLYVVTFEGAGYKKVLFKSRSDNDLAPKLKQLGFSQYKVLRKRNYFYYRDLRREFRDNDGCINWHSLYSKNGLFLSSYNSFNTYTTSQTFFLRD